MGYFYPPPPPQPQVLPSLPQGTPAYGNAPPTAEGPDWNLDEIRSLWPQEQWAAQAPPIIAGQLALTQANPPFPVPFPAAALEALIRSTWPAESWPAQFIRGAGGFEAPLPPIIPGSSSTDTVPYALLLSTWPQESWGTQRLTNITSFFARNPFSPVLLQSSGNTGAAATSITATFPNAVTAGSLLVAYTGADVAGTPGVSDNINGTYNHDVTTGVNGIWSFPGAAASAANSTTVTYTFSVSANMFLIIEEWSGQNITARPLDKTATNSGTGTSGTTGTAANLAQAAELALAMAEVAQSTATGAVMPTPAFLPSPSSPKGNTAGQIAAANLVTFSPSNVSTTFTWTSSVAFNAGIATYKFTPADRFPTTPTGWSWTLPLTWPQEAWYAQSECAIAGGLAHLQLPPLFQPNSTVAALSNIRASWPLEYWTAQVSGPIGGWYVNPLTSVPFPVAHNELRAWPQESWPAQNPPSLAAGFAFGLPPVPFISVGEQMSIRMLWPEESWRAQQRPPIAAIPQITVGNPETPEFLNSGWPIFLWPQDAWSAQTSAIVAAQLAPLFVPPLANPIQPQQFAFVSVWPQESWVSQRAPLQVPIFVPQNPNVIVVPEVRGMYFYDAQQALLGAGLRINTPVLTSVPESTTLGIVVAQSIAPKTLVSRFNPPQVTITVTAYLTQLPPQTP